MFSKDVTAVVTFGPFRLDLAGRALYRDDAEVPLGSRALDVLCALAAEPGELVTKDELIARAWHGVVVEEHNIQVQVSTLRKALGGDAEGRRFIVTVPGRGYRLTHAKRLERASSASAARAASDRPSIAVLPFINMTKEPRYGNFIDGLVVELITEFARLRWLSVLSRSSSFAYKGTSVDAPQAGRELGARYVVEGGIRASEGRARVTARLIETETGAHLWAERCDCTVDDMFARQEQLVERIVSVFEAALRAAEIARERESPADKPYSLQARALAELFTATKEGSLRAERLLRQAIAIDPSYSDALAALIDCKWQQVLNGWIPTADVAAARLEIEQLARQAVAADPLNGRALAAAGFAIAGVRFHHEEGMELVARAIELLPYSAYVQNAAGQVYVYSGKLDEAIQCLDSARRSSPLDPHATVMHNGVTVGLGHALMFKRDFEACLQWNRRALLEKPEWTSSRRLIQVALAHLGHVDAARRQVGELLKVQPNSSMARAKTSIYRRGWMNELYQEGLQKAGLPEK
jgi:adenylate cyclase